jgi:hypothetical protein
MTAVISMSVSNGHLMLPKVMNHLITQSDNMHLKIWCNFNFYHLKKIEFLYTHYFILKYTIAQFPYFCAFDFRIIE